RQTHGSQAERDWAEAAKADARFDSGYGEVAGRGGPRVLPISRCTGERGALEGVPQRCAPHVASSVKPAKPAEVLDVDALSGVTRPSDPGGGDRASLASRAVYRPVSEVGTVCVSSASTGLCGGCEVTRIPTATNLERWKSFFRQLPESDG